VVIRNCTFIDGTDRVLRHYSSVGKLEVVIFDHNTVYNALSMHGCLGLGWVGGARAYHQHHPVSSPPVEHLDDILRNGRLFHERWGEWPMTGWLEVVLEPMAKSVFAPAISLIELVIAPLPKLCIIPSTVGAWQRRAQWSTLLVPITTRANFWKT